MKRRQEMCQDLWFIDIFPWNKHKGLVQQVIHTTCPYQNELCAMKNWKLVWLRPHVRSIQQDLHYTDLHHTDLHRHKPKGQDMVLVLKMMHQHKTGCAKCPKQYQWTTTATRRRTINCLLLSHTFTSNISQRKQWTKPWRMDLPCRYFLMSSRFNKTLAVNHEDELYWTKHCSNTIYHFKQFQGFHIITNKTS